MSKELTKEELVFKLTEVRYLIGEQAYDQLKEIVGEYEDLKLENEILAEQCRLREIALEEQQKLRVSREWVEEWCGYTKEWGKWVPDICELLDFIDVEVVDE
jgi:hypothetical protein